MIALAFNTPTSAIHAPRRLCRPFSDLRADAVPSLWLSSRGRRIIVTRTRNGYACSISLRPSDAGLRIGWLPLASLRRLVLPPSPPSAWIGIWRGATSQQEQSISIHRVGATLVARGLDVFDDPYYRAQNMIPTGDFQGRIRLAGNRAKVLLAKYDPCRVSAWLFGDDLLVADNDRCGGINVTFRGIYRRSRP